MVKTKQTARKTTGPAGRKILVASKQPRQSHGTPNRRRLVLIYHVNEKRLI